jgi:HEPN domain-containing protein
MKTREDIVRSWIRKAEHDLLNARHTLATLGKNCPYDTVCFHAQQAAEKYLKALLSGLQIGFPKSHDIGELITRLPERRRPTATADEVARLSRYAVAARYPDFEEELQRADARQALRISDKIKKSVLRSIQASGIAQGELTLF